MLPFHLIILGIPGSGKGTQAKMLARYYKMPYVEMGELIRLKSKEKSPVAQQIHTMLNKGFLIPDEIVKEIIKEKLKEIPQDKTIVFDGFPRNISQVKFLEKVLKERNVVDRKAVLLNIDEKTAYQRLSGRRRADDVSHVIQNRIKSYKNETSSVISYFKKRSELIEINGEQEINKVFKDIIAKLEGKD